MLEFCPSDYVTGSYFFTATDVPSTKTFMELLHHGQLRAATVILRTQPFLQEKKKKEDSELYHRKCAWVYSSEETNSQN